MPFDPTSFGASARYLMIEANKLSKAAQLARIYVQDTAQFIGQADYDLKHAAACLEDAASDIRILLAKVEQMRRDQSIPALMAAE